MHRQINRSGKHCLVNLFREQPLATRLRQSPILNHVTGRLDNDTLHPIRRETEHRDQPVLDSIRLPQCERAAPRSDPDDFVCLHD